MIHDEELEYDEAYDDHRAEANLEEFCTWLEDSFLGDSRFELVQKIEPGPGPDEHCRVQLVVDNSTHFMVAALPEEGYIRVGLATESLSVCEAIEEAVDESGETLTEFVADAMEGSTELDYEAQQFHDEFYYFCSDITYDAPEELADQSFRDDVVAYLEAYIDSLSDCLD